MDDTFKTIVKEAEGYITERKSKFISYIFPIKTEEETKTILEDYRKKYYNAHHVCWAYMLGPTREDFRSNDDGEPSGTAGRPILGQINSNELTDVLILVVRYFGGTQLGTGGLIKAYKEAAAAAIENAKIVTKTIDDTYILQFEYPLLNEVMRILNQHDEVKWTQNFTETCEMEINIRQSQSQQLSQLLSSIYGVSVTKTEKQAIE
ncbi:MAG: YigZ family protein [Dysgonamonadaceae bacterium]|nr:YigZ family protein [Dysgonamonadaceae bacterium]MDD4729836.1 YigZ family protein [Dysgonamonadaceae bacterium]